MIGYRQSAGNDISKIVGDEPGFLNRVYNKVNDAIGYLFDRGNTSSNGLSGVYRGSARIGTVLVICISGTLVAILSWAGIIEYGKLKRVEKPLDAKLVKKVVDIYDLDGTQSLDPNEVQKLLEDFKSKEISNDSLEGFVEEHQQDLQQNSNTPY